MTTPAPGKKGPPLLLIGCGALIVICACMAGIGAISNAMTPPEVRAERTATAQSQAEQVTANRTATAEAREAATAVAPPATAAPTTLPAPLSIETLPEHIQRTVRSGAMAARIENGNWVFMQYQARDGFDGGKGDGRQLARDVVFAVYASGVPVTGVSVVIQQPNGQLGLTAVLGSNVAAREPATTWTDRGVGPTVFIDWLKSRQRTGLSQFSPDRAELIGPWQN